MSWKKPDRQLESRFQKDVMDYAVRRGWTADKVVSQSRRGFFDCIFVRRGEVVFAEVKRDEDEEPTTQQQLRHKEFREHGARVEVIRTLEEAIDVLR